MGYDLGKSQAGNVHRHHDDWDEVHQQMIEVQEQNRVQKKSLAVSDPSDADEQQADEIARKVTGDDHADGVDINSGSGQKIMRAENDGPEQKDFYFNQEIEWAQLLDITGNVILNYNLKAPGMHRLEFGNTIAPGSYTLVLTLADGSKQRRALNKLPGTEIVCTLDVAYKVTDRISSNGKNVLFGLVDLKGEPITYGDGEDKSGPIMLPEGTQVVKLELHPTLKDYMKIIVWMNGSYREGYVSANAFGGEISEDSPFTVDAFINDAERTLYNSDLTYEELKTSEADFVQKTAGFRKVAETVRKDITDYKNGKLRITPAMLKEIRIEDDALLTQNKENHPALAEHFAGQLSQVRNPTVESKSANESVTFFPLSRKWMEAHLGEALLYEWNQLPMSELEGNAGFVLSGQDARDGVNLLLKLRNRINSVPADFDMNSPETKWVLNKDLSKTEVLIVIESKTWNFDKINTYASLVPLNTSFGMLRASPVMTIMAHELNMTGFDNGSKYSMGETHLDEYETKSAFQEAKDGGLSTVSGSGRKMDSLFQAHSSTSIIILSTYFNRIRSKQ